MRGFREFIDANKSAVKDRFVITESERLTVIENGLRKLASFKEDIEAKLNIFLTINPKYEVASAIKPEEILTYVARWPLVIHLISAVTCLSLSATCHTMCCFDQNVSDFVCKLDLTGICFLIAGSSYSAIYYGFACEGVKHLRIMFLIVITVMCTLISIMLMIPYFSTPAARTFRGWCFIILGLSPGIAVIASSQKSDQMLDYDTWQWLWGGLVYIGGALIYIAKIPEKFFPKRFDYVGASH